MRRPALRGEAAQGGETEPEFSVRKAKKGDARVLDQKDGITIKSGQAHRETSHCKRESAETRNNRQGVAQIMPLLITKAFTTKS